MANTVRSAAMAVMARYRNEPWFVESSYQRVKNPGYQNYTAGTVVLKVNHMCPFTNHRDVLGFPVRIEVII